MSTLGVTPELVDLVRESGTDTGLGLGVPALGRDGGLQASSGLYSGLGAGLVGQGALMLKRAPQARQSRHNGHGGEEVNGQGWMIRLARHT